MIIYFLIPIDVWSGFRKLPQIAKYMGLTWVLSAPDGPHVGPMNLAIRDSKSIALKQYLNRLVMIAT